MELSDHTDTIDPGEDEYRYSMNHRERGKLIIINNKEFARETKMNVRSGTDKDAESLCEDFRHLGFDVKSEKNLTADQMLQLMIQASKDKHTDRDCFAMAVLTHGDVNEGQDVLYGTDTYITVERLIDPIKNCETLAGKPKIFIFQACRGDKYDPGKDVCDSKTQSDGTEVSRAKSKPDTMQRIPIDADCVYAYSTVPGYFSWRNPTNGSWFIQALHGMIGKYRSRLDKMEFVNLLTRVNHEVAIKFESKGMKQVPSVVSMLTKELYFPPKL